MLLYCLSKQVLISLANLTPDLYLDLLEGVSDVDSIFVILPNSIIYLPRAYYE
jgi:hypothetical protein